MYERLIRESQLDYDSTLYDLEYTIALKEKSLIYKDNLPEKYDDFFIRKIDDHIKRLDWKIGRLESILVNQVEQKYASNQYHGYIDDLNENKLRLERRQKKYKEMFKRSKLFVFEDRDDNNIPNDPITWELGDIEKISQFIPVVTAECYTHNKEEEANTTVNEVKEFDYSNVVFRYSDTKDLIKDRFIIYWDCDNDCKTEDEPETSDGFHLDNINVAYINDYGYAYKIEIKSKNAIIKSKNREGKNIFTLSKPLMPRGVYDEQKDIDKTKYIPYTHTETRVIFNRHGEILLYPLDQNPFTTKSISSINSFKVEGCTSATVKLNSLVYSIEEDTPPTNVFLHCTLPEWNHRLRKQLNITQALTNQYQLLCFPHLENLKHLSDLNDDLDLHIKNPYVSMDYSDGLKKNEKLFSYLKECVENNDCDNSEISLPSRYFQNLNKEIDERVELKRAINELSNSVQDIIDNPNKTFPFGVLSIQKNHLERACEKLLNLLLSPQLLHEVNRYIFVSKKQIENGYQKEGLMPPGPYMDDEPYWDKIFITIAECYAVLSQSNKCREKLWENEILPGIEALGDFSPQKDEIDAAIYNEWKEKTIDESEYIENNDYLYDQTFDLKESHESKSNDSILMSMVKDYDSIIKPYLAFIVPGPGTPCVLQVALSCFQSEIESLYLKKAFSKNTNVSTFHVRAYVNVLKINGIIKVGEVVSGTKNVVTDGLLARYNKIEIRDEIIERKKNLAKFNIRDHFSGESGGEAWFYDLFSWDESREGKATRLQRIGAFSKVVYGIYNLAYSIQHLYALSEKAKEEGWSTSKIYYEYVTGAINVFIATGALAGTTMNALLSLRSHVNNSKQLSKKFLHRKQLIGNLVDGAAVIISVMQLVVSTIDMIVHIDDKNYRKAVLSGVSVLSNGLITSGFVIQEVGKRISSRFISVAFGGALIGIGTFISLVLLAYDLANLYKDYKSTAQQKKIEGVWELFKKEKPLTYDLSNKFLDLSKNTVKNYWDLSSQLNCNVKYDIRLDYIGDVYGHYVSYWNDSEYIVNKKNKKSPILYIDDNIKETVLFPGVRLTYLSWHAVIPLYLRMNRDNQRMYTDNDIREMVYFDWEWLDKDDHYTYGVWDVEDIIRYYKRLKVRENNNSSGDKIYVMYKGVKVLISKLLEVGDFNPGDHDDFFMKKYWDHDFFNVRYKRV